MEKNPDMKLHYFKERTTLPVLIACLVVCAGLCTGMDAKLCFMQEAGAAACFYGKCHYKSANN